MAKKREVKFSILFRQWVRAYRLKTTCHFELKQTTKDYISFDCVEPQQLDYGNAINSGRGILMRNIGGNGEPDYSFLRQDPVYIAIKYPTFFCIIHIKVFYKEKVSSGRKSLTSARAKEIAKTVVEL